MGNDETKPCSNCEKPLPRDARYCMTCGAQQAVVSAEADAGSFDLVDAGTTPEPQVEGTPPAPSEPTVEVPDAAPVDEAPEPDSEPEIELIDVGPADETTAAEEDGDPKRIGDTVRMKLSDMVDVWAEDERVGDVPDIDPAPPEPMPVPVPSTRRLWLLAVIAGIAAAAAILLLATR